MLVMYLDMKFVETNNEYAKFIYIFTELLMAGATVRLTLASFLTVGSVSSMVTY